MKTNINLCKHLQTHVCLPVCIPISVHPYSIYTYTYINMYIHTFTYNYMCVMCIMAIHTLIYSHACLSTNMYTYMHKYICHTGVFSGTIKSFVCALGTDSSMTELTINSTLYTFIEQVNFCDLQKMVLQFAICFIPTLGYTYMAYTLHN